MSRRKPNNLGRLIGRFFEQYLPHLRGLSTHTIKSYRDALVLFLRFAAEDAKRPVERLDITDLDRDRVMRFLDHIETVRGNGVATRNARLAALHTVARFLAAEHPQHLEMLQAVLGIPFKRGAREAPIEYFETQEMAALMQSIDRTAPGGQRDYALFGFCSIPAPASRRFSICAYATSVSTRPTRFASTARAASSVCVQSGQTPRGCSAN